MRKLLKGIFGSVVLLLFVAVAAKCEARAEEPARVPDYLTFTATEDDSSIKFSFETGDVYYQTEKSSGVYTNGTEIVLDKDEYVKFNGENVTTSVNKHFEMSGGFIATGSVTSLTDGYGDDSKVQLSASCYKYMFADCATLKIDKSGINGFKLIAENLATECYQYMFYNCISLEEAPKLSATTLSVACYGSMFEGCSSLTKAPELPAITLAIDCYDGMFSGCSLLTEAPALPATVLTNRCYQLMFEGCNKLTKAPALPATTLADNCYNNMFRECSSLTEAPALPATTLAADCYNNMFYSCSKLTEAPALPATTLADFCYYEMFFRCSSLIEAPALPATTLAEDCYNAMFGECSSLTKAPVLPATTLAKACYRDMFYECSKVTEMPVLPATALADRCYDSMFKGCTNLLVSKSLNEDLKITDTFTLPATTAELAVDYMFLNAGEDTAISSDKLIDATPESNVTYYCKYRKCNIKYELNGGVNNSTNLAIYTVGIGVPKFTSPTKDGYVFEGWYEDSLFTKKIESISNIRDEDVTLYAKWKPQVYKISYELNGGINSNENPAEYEFSKGVAKLSNPAKSGYTFEGWYSDDLFNYKVISIPADNKGNVTLYAKWKPNVYKISYEISDGTNSNDNPLEYTVGEGVKLSVPVKDGYTFDGWYSDAAFTTKVDSITVENIGDITLFAKWTKNPYTETLKVKNATYELAMDSDDQITGVKLTSYTDKKATTLTVSTVTYNGRKVNVTEIGDNAFKNNKKLKSITIGNSVTNIGKNAFSGCTALKTVKLGTKVTTIGDKAFYKCTALTTVSGGKNVSAIGASAFAECRKLKSFTLSTKLTTIGNSAFANCKAITKITLNSKVTSVGAKAFKGCTALKAVTIKTTKLTDKKLGKSAFSSINANATIKVPKSKLSAYQKLLKKVGVTKKTQKIRK